MEELEQAREAAARYAPPPRYDPFIAGIAGLCIVSAIVVFSDGETSYLLNIAAFAGPCWYFYRQKSKNEAAVQNELRQIRNAHHS